MQGNKLVILLPLFCFTLIKAYSTVFVDWGEQWVYHKGTSNPSGSGIEWTAADFNAEQWTMGNAPFRYGDGSGGTVLSDMQGSYTTFFIRKEFNVTNAGEIGELLFSANYDDGFVLWINSEQILKINAPDNYYYDQVAPGNHESGTGVDFRIFTNQFELKEGKNVIAIQGFNVSSGSSDFYLDARLEGKIKLEETDVVSCNVKSGFYYNPFNIELSTANEGDTIRYTLDGSDPRYSLTSLTTISPSTVSIDPNSTAGGRGKTGGVVIRASKFEKGFAPGKTVTRNYIFPHIVKYQSNPGGGGWPEGNVNGQVIDLIMDRRISDDSRFKNDMENALLDLPSITITTDMDHLFGAEKGIYVNAQFHGRAWERPANIELINPDGTEGFNIDAGIRIRGGWSRHDNYPKHAFRLFFRSEYGESKLNYPLFEHEGTDKFDKIDLRSTQNYSWANGGGYGKHNTMNRDVFSRDTQRDMNQPYTRSRYYHLYINGLYWGVFQSQERGDAAFADSYFGGKKDDYDVIKVDVGENWDRYEIEATDGNTDAWMEIWEMCQNGFIENEDYFKLIGKNAEGKRDTSLKVWIDVENLIDFMLIIFYTGNFDSPVSKFSGNYRPNNFFAFNNRARKWEGFRFLVHDAEHTILTDPADPGIGLEENRVNIGRINNQRMNVTSFTRFHPQWLHFKLSENEEYRTQFSDRVFLHFFNNGVFTPDSCINRFKNTSDQLDLAIIAESARWGDGGGTWPPRNKTDDWLPAVNRVVNDYFPYRTDIVLDQLVEEELFNETLTPPEFLLDNQKITDYHLTVSENHNLTMNNTNNVGTIYFTTNGEDPRAVGGATSNGARSGRNKKEMVVEPGARIKARILYMGIWSPLREIYLEDEAIYDHLKVTELHYHPVDVDSINGNDLEFIEIRNTGLKTIDLSGFSFTDGVLFTFPEGTTIAPDSFMIMVSNMNVFEEFYGFTPDFEYSGNLSNAGEQIVLQTNMNQTIFSFSYSDDFPWPVAADGNGFSLVSAQSDPQGDPNLLEYWTLSGYANGSPKSNDINSSVSTSVQRVENRINFKLYPNPAAASLNLEFSLTREEYIEIQLINVNGKLHRKLVDQNFPPGKYNQICSLGSYDPGIYFVVFRTKNSITTKKLIVQESR